LHQYCRNIKFYYYLCGVVGYPTTQYIKFSNTMPQKAMPSLRYFARFKGNFGYLRATARNGEIRKSILTPLVITREQLKRLNTRGYIDPVQGVEDMRLDGRLREYTATAWEVFNALIAAGTFAPTPAEHISTAILNRHKGKQKERCKRMLAKSGYDVDNMPSGSFSPGGHNPDGSRMSAKDERELKALLAASFPEEGERDGK
jgi:hypothetical protein